MKTCYYFLLFLLLASCGSFNIFRKDSLRTDELSPINQTDILLKTYSDYTRGIGSEITILPNSKFEYKYRNCFGGGFSSGRFSIKNHEIIFSPNKELKWNNKYISNGISSDTIEVKKNIQFILIYTEKGLHEKKGSLRYFRVPSYK